MDARDGEGKGGGGRESKYVFFINVQAVGCREGFTFPTIQGLADFFYRGVV